MNHINLHSLNSLSINQMKSIQENLRTKISDSPYGKRPKLVSGVDISYNGKTNHSIAVIVTFDFKSQKLLDVTHAISETTFRYQPGYLAFRELPPFLAAWKKLSLQPDIVFFDGHGRIHPRRLGIATHAGFLIDKPTIGIAKSRLIGQFEEPANNVGNYNYVYDHHEILGVILRTKENTKPVFVSAGHKITLNEAIDFTLHFVLGKYRIPEVTRIADWYSKKLKEEGYRYE